MSKADDNTCPKCAKPRKQVALSSMTQWIFACDCNVRPTTETTQEPIYLCKKCGNRIAKGRSGSFTQWVFRSNTCKCETPQPGEVAQEDSAGGEGSSHEKGIENALSFDRDEGAEEELEVDSSNFPKDRYKALLKVGHGAAGSVFLCRDRLLGTKVAVKCLRHISGGHLIAFQQEAKATSSLHHPNIVKIYNFGLTESSAPYMVMEYIEGISLEQYIRRFGPVSVKETLELFETVADALSYSHGKGVFHRDIKSSNILIADYSKDPDTAEATIAPNSVRLIDFGVALIKHASQEPTLVQGHTVVGTPAYMPPDQARGKPYDERSEIYALGCALFEALIGCTPFQGETALEIINKHASEMPPTVSSLIDVSEYDGLDELVATCLAKEQSQRYQTMIQFRTACRRILDLIEGGTESSEDDNGTASSDKATGPSDSKNSQSESPIKKHGTKIGIGIAMLVMVIASAITVGLTFKNEQTSSKRINLEDHVSVVSRTPTLERDESIRTMLKNGITRYPALLWSEGDATDNDMKVFQGSKVATEVNFTELPIGDNALKYLAKSPLAYLDLSSTNVKTLEFVPAEDTLEVLQLTNSHIKDDALARLSKFRKLKDLTLNATDVTAAGIRKHLKMVPLEDLSLHDCPNISESDRDALANEFPMWKVHPWKKELLNKNVIDISGMAASTFLVTGKPQKSFELWNRWNKFADSHKESDPNRRLKVRVLASLAACYDYTKNWDQARQAANEAVAIATRYGTALEYAESYTALFHHYYYSKNISEAAKAGTKAVEWSEKAYGEPDMQLALDVGTVLTHLNRPADAIPILEKSMKMREHWKDTLEADIATRSRSGKLIKQDLQSILPVRGLLAVTQLQYCACLSSLNRNDEAKNLLVKSIRLLEEMPNPDFADVLCQDYIFLADCYLRLKRPQDALTANKRAMTMLETSSNRILKRRFIPLVKELQEKIEARLKEIPR